MRPLDAGARDRALLRARRLRWAVAFVAAAASVAGTAVAKATFRGHSKTAAAPASPRAAHAAKPVATPLPRRPMPNNVPLPPTAGSSAPAATPAPAQAPAPAPAPAPASAPAPAPVVSGGS